MLRGITTLSLIAALMFSAVTMAAVYSLPADIGANGSPFKDCSGVAPVFTCTKKVDIKGGDSVVLTGDVTLDITDDLKVTNGGSVDNSGFMFNVMVTGEIEIEGSGSVVMNNLTATGDIIILKQATLTGNVTSSAGDIEISDGLNTITGNIDAQNGDVTIEGGNNFIDGNVTASGGAGNLTIDATSIVSGACNPDHPQCNGGPGGNGVVCSTAQIATDGEEFRGISGSSDGNVLAAGKDGSIYHYDGSNWTKTFDTGAQLHSIDVVAPNLAYTVGSNGEVFEFDGFTWSNLPAPTGEDLNDVWAISTSEAWVVGKKAALYRWNGVIWQDMSGAAEANVDNNQELTSAWGGASFFYAAEKDGDLYRYSRTIGPWTKITACSSAFNLDANDIWGDGSGNLYIGGKDKGPNPDEAAVFVYNEGSNTCSKVFGTDTEKDIESISGNGSTIYGVGKKGLVLDNSSGSWKENVVGNDDYNAVWVSPSNTAYYAGKKGMLSTCTPLVTLDHFVISPATFAASTCKPNTITITAEDSANIILPSYTGSVTITTSSGHGNWSINTANGVLSPDPHSTDDGRVDYTFDPMDASTVILDLTNTHAEDMTIRVSEGGVFSDSANINFGDNVFVITEDPVQVAGRPLAMNIAMWRNDRGGANCFIDTNYNYNPHSLDISIDRNGVLPSANNPTIGGTPIVDGTTAPINFDFQTVPGEANFDLANNDVGQFRLLVSDNTLVHSDMVIFGISEIITLRPFGIAVTDLRDTLTSALNPANATPANPIFTTAGHDLSATVAGVLWDAVDDVDSDGNIDVGRVYADNNVAPSYAWETVLSVSLLASSYTPSPGTLGSLNNRIIAQAAYNNGEAPIIDLQYTEVGSFTLQAAVTDYLGVGGLNVGGDDTIVGRFIPAYFDVSVTEDGTFAETCGAFTYLGEDFGYDTAPRISVTAMNSLDDPTLQYRDAYVKLTASSVTVVANQDDATDGTDMVPLDVSYTPATMGFAPQNNGSVNYSFGADTYRYGPDTPLGAFSKAANSQVVPFLADINPEITSIDDGEVPDNIAPGTYLLDPIGNNQRFGRLRMENVHGSELYALVMPVVTEFWTGFSFQKNNLDICTIIDASDLISVGNPVGLSVPLVVNPIASLGEIDYSYPAPAGGATGYVDTRTDLGSAAHLWLRYDWLASGEFDDDPSARATFGIFEGNPVQIYIQQIYQ